MCLLWLPSQVRCHEGHKPRFFAAVVARDSGVGRVERSLDENEWVHLCGHSIWISSISSLIYSTSSPSKRPALHIGGVLWLRRFGKLTLLSDLWLGGSTVALSLSPFLLLFPQKIPLKSAGWEGFPLVWRHIFNLSLLVFHSSPSTNPSQSRRPLRSWHSPFPAALLYLSFLVLPSHLTPLCDGWWRTVCSSPLPHPWSAFVVFSQQCTYIETIRWTFAFLKLDDAHL